jgi:hypothetical protein
MRSIQLRSLLVFSALTIAAAAWADPVYKSTDKDGHTTYSSKPPLTPKDKAKTVELSIDPNQNVMPADRSRPTGSFPGTHSGEATANPESNAIADAEAALRQAEQAYMDGQTAQPGDFTGKAGGGTGPSVQRINRINQLQEAVDRAREALERARSGHD